MRNTITERSSDAAEELSSTPLLALPRPLQVVLLLSNSRCKVGSYILALMSQLVTGGERFVHAQRLTNSRDLSSVGVAITVWHH